jgi:RNA polymerase sigma-70 factor (ECF subfamily)
VSALEAVQETIVPLGAPSHAERTLQGLYERHSDRIFGFCRRRLRSHPEAEDAMQTTFLQAFRALQRGVVPVSEEAWLFKIAENVCLSAHRSNGRRSERELADGTAAIDFAPARESGADALVGLDEALAAIPPRQREVFVLRELRGLSYREIAASLGLSVTAVEMLVFRARRNLARALENGAGLRGRIASAFNLGALVNAVKTTLTSGAAAKTVSTAVAVVALTALPAGDSAVRGSAAPAKAVGTPLTDRPAELRTTAPPAAAARLEPRGRDLDRPTVGASADDSHRGMARRPRPEAETASGAPAPPAPQVTTTPAPPVPQPPAVVPVQLPPPPPIEVPTLPQFPQTPQLPELELPQLPQLPVEVPTLPDPGAIELPELPEDPLLP